MSGGVTSTVHVRESGVGSSFLAPSTAVTANVCDASVSPENEAGEVHRANGAPSSEHRNVPPGSST